MINKIEEILQEIESFAPATAADVEAFRIKILGKKGSLGALMEEFKSVPAEQKRELGQKLNHLKSVATERINTLKEELQNKAAMSASHIDDMTRPGTSEQVGSRHPISLVKNEIVSSRAWAILWQMVLRLRTTGMYSLHSTSLLSTRHAICRIPSSSRATPM